MNGVGFFWLGLGGFFFPAGSFLNKLETRRVFVHVQARYKVSAKYSSVITVGTLKISQHHRAFWGVFVLVFLMLHFRVPL